MEWCRKKKIRMTFAGFSSLIFKLSCFPVAQLVEHGVSNAKIMGSIPRESKTW